jgi:predicted phosphohydrolase
MQFAFDLISDLHVESWDDFDWAGQATSQICIVAGDVARDHTALKQTLTHLGRCYQAVLYIDGNEEHKNHWDTLGSNFRNIAKMLTPIKNVVYLQDNVIIMNGVAILGTNGWWSWDFDADTDAEDSKYWFRDHYQCQRIVVDAIDHMAYSDAGYLESSVKKLQTVPDVSRIVIVTHTVPGYDLVSHDIDLNGTHRINTMGNSMMQQVLAADTENKISHWCFGHYHGSVDRTHNEIRYVNNCRGRGDTAYRQVAYYPKRIEINF